MEESPPAGSAPEPAVAVYLRPLSLRLIGALAVVFTLRYAREVLIPLVLALFLSYLLDPIVDWMEARKIPRGLGAAVVMIAVAGGIGAGAYTLGRQGEAPLEQLPAAAQKFRQSLQEGRADPDGTLNKVQKAAGEMEKAAAEAAGSSSPKGKGAPKVEVARPALNLRDYLWVGTVGVFGLALEALLVFFLIYFLLVSGNGFRRKLVKIAGPSLAEKRITVEILDEIETQIQRFLLVQLYTGLFTAAAVWLAFRWIGLENAGMWGIVAGVTKSIPFLGGILIVGGAALVGYLQFGTLSMALLILAVSIAIESVAGLLVSTWLTSKTCRINSVSIFVGILFWAWLWGVWGMLLGIPILMAAKTVCDRIEGLKPIGALLDSESRGPESSC